MYTVHVDASAVSWSSIGYQRDGSGKSRSPSNACRDARSEVRGERLGYVIILFIVGILLTSDPPVREFPKRADKEPDQTYI